MILKASMSLIEMMRINVPSSPTSFLKLINNRHLLNILKGISDAPQTYFEDFQDIANIWIHEVCRTITDRIAEQQMTTQLFKRIKGLGAGFFKVREKLLSI